MNRLGELDLASQDVVIEVVRTLESSCGWFAPEVPPPFSCL
jgi:hypothetical protein